MQSNRAGSIIVIFGGMLIGIFAMLSVVMTHGNSIGEVARYLLFTGFAFCCIQPRNGFFVWLVMCGYNDLLKRLMIFGGRMSWADLPYVLGITPMMFAGVVISCLMGGLTGSRPLKKMHWIMFTLGIFMMLLNGALTYLSTGHSVSSTMQSLANDGLYYLLLFVVPVLFKDVEDIVRICRFCIWVFSPVAVYGIVQQYYGFQEFEIAYLKTGMSIEGIQLFTNRVRAFSTLNSPTALSAVCAVFAAMCLLFSWGPGNRKHKRLLNPIVGSALALVFIGGLLASTSRTELLIIPLAPIAVWCLQKPGRTTALYLAIASGVVILVSLSAFLLDNLETISTSITGNLASGSFNAEMMSVQTYSDRLYGFVHVLLNPRAWTVFGYGIKEGISRNDRFFCHDPISATLIHYGAFGLCVIACTFGVILRWFHGKVFHLKNPYHRWLGATLQALALGIALVSMLSGSILGTFPINVIFCFFWGAILLLSQASQNIQTEPEEAVAEVREEEKLPHRRIPFWQSHATQ